MNVEIASRFYNAAGVTEDNIPFSERSKLLFDRIRNECKSVVFSGAKTLEIGCGNGRYSFELERMGAIPTGIDCADKIIEYANDFSKKNKSKARFICCDALMLPFEQNEFDIVFLVGNNIVEFSLSDFDIMCRQVSKILKESGIFCIAMNDSYILNNGKSFDLQNYNPEEGLIVKHYEIPEKGIFEYHLYFWTVSMVKFICARYFSNISIKQLDEKRYWLECRK